MTGSSLGRSIALAAAVVSAAGCEAFGRAHTMAAVAAPELRFASRRDLGLPGGPIPLDIVFTIHPGIRLDALVAGWPPEEAQPSADQFQAAAAFRSLAANVLAEAFRSAVEQPPGAHARIEDLRRSVSNRLPGVADLPPLCARALLVVDFRPSAPGHSDLAGQLSVRLYDISFARYEEVSLHNPRLLIFEDFAEVAPAPAPARFAGTVLLAWREALGRMQASPRFRDYLALGREPLDETRREGAVLLGIVLREARPRTPAETSNEWIESSFLFPRLEPTPPPKTTVEKAPPAPASVPGPVPAPVPVPVPVPVPGTPPDGSPPDGSSDDPTAPPGPPPAAAQEPAASVPPAASPPSEAVAPAGDPPAGASGEKSPDEAR